MNSDSEKTPNYLQNPIMLADGRMGMVIRQYANKVGVQVPGEEDIRWMAPDDIEDTGGGALVEQSAEGGHQP